MRSLLLPLILLVLIVCALIVGCTDIPEDSAVTVKTEQLWGAVKPPYVVDAAMFTTTTTARPRSAPTHRTTMRAASVAPPVVDGAWSCGGDLPPCWVMDRENPNRDLTVYNGGSHHEVGYTGGNPEGDSTASGKWQFLRSTWNGFGGYVNAADAPWEVQDAKAREVWAGGRGCRAWSAC